MRGPHPIRSSLRCQQPRLVVQLLELRRTSAELAGALSRVKTLRELLPICSYCKKIRDDGDYWQAVELYLQEHGGPEFTHGICPDCYHDHVVPLMKRDRA